MKCFAYGVMLALVGCAGETNDDDYPVEPSGQDPSTTPTGGGNGGAGSLLSGRICVSDSILSLSSCRTNDLAGFQVALGASTATTDAGGNFRVEIPENAPPAFTVSGPGAVTTTTPYDPSLASLPVIDADVYARTMASNGVFASEGTGAIIGNVTRNGQPLQDVTVSSTTGGAFQTFYDVDGTGPLGTNATGARGVFWIPGLISGATGLSFSDGAGGETTVAGVQVVNGGVTILDSTVLP
jgi:hypothetical protein